MRTRLAAVAAVAALAACPNTPRPVTPPPTPPDAATAATVPAPDAAPAPPMSLSDSGIVPEWLDATADPCQDFFQYACGGFLATAKIPPDRSSWGAILIVEQRQEDLLRKILEQAARAPGADPVTTKLGDYYAACTDEAAIEKAGIAPIQPMLDEIARVKDWKSAVHAVIDLHADGVFPLFDVGPAQDYADATLVIASFDQGGLGLPDRDYYLENRGNMKQVRDTYRAHVERMFALTGLDKARARAAAADVMKVETALARLAQTKVARRDPHAIYHRIERAGLRKAARTFPWDDYFTKMGLGQVTQVTVNDPAYFAGIDKLLHRQRPAALRSYLEWTLLDDAAPHLTRAFVDEDFAMDKALTGVQQLPPRWRRCVHRVDRDLGELLGRPYVAARFPGGSKALAVSLVHSVKAAMHAELARLPWMDPATITAARTKLDKMAYLVGYPDHWRTYDFPISRTDYAADVLAAGRFELHHMLGKIGKPVDKSEWYMTPPTVNAYYDPSLNEMVLPAGQLQPPFFKATFHPAINFGAIGGGTIGHEMTHGFDDEGSQFDGDGNLRNWWSKSTSGKFHDATRCVVDQYARYEAVPGVKLNGKLTAGENIADIGGVKLGFLAYQAWRATQTPPPPTKVGPYTDDQLYFLGYGQSWCAKTTPEQAELRAHSNPHSPPRWRVNGVVADQPGFAKAFACKAGTPMAPKNACSVW
jgi:putative endopeptidase